MFEAEFTHEGDRCTLESFDQLDRMLTGPFSRSSAIRAANTFLLYHRLQSWTKHAWWEYILYKRGKNIKCSK
jgi:hypothetical protein